MSDRIHPMANVGFGSSSQSYERGRPDYPQSAVDCLVQELGLKPGATLVDLGAGTGKFTRLLVPSGAHIVAIEPIQAMRERFSEILPEVQVLDGTAEAIPLPDSSAQAVIAAQAFHWFATEEVLKEIQRILVPGGKLGLAWNIRDDSCEWMAVLTKIIDPYEATAPRFRHRAWEKPFQAGRFFSPLQQRVFSHWVKGSVQILQDRVASMSFVASLPEAERQEVLGRVRELIENHPQTKGRVSFDQPYRTEVYWCESLKKS
jgi:SAM-dependent methyltransferase